MYSFSATQEQMNLSTVKTVPCVTFIFQILQMKETTNPFSVTVFNDMLYWSDAKRRLVQAAKLSGKNHQVILKRLRQPFAVKVSKDVYSLVGTGLMVLNGHYMDFL